MAGYSGTPLMAKLGIKPEFRVVLRNAPAGFLSALGPLPDGVSIAQSVKDRTDVDFALIFARDAAALGQAFLEVKAALKATGMLWAAWPKKAAKLPADLAEDVVRRIGLDAGLVDVKVCAIDDVWSGLKFVYRAADRERRS